MNTSSCSCVYVCGVAVTATETDDSHLPRMPCRGIKLLSLSLSLSLSPSLPLSLAR